MARAGQQAGGAITIWMIIFAALWLTSTVFLIILYTGQEELANKNAELEARNQMLMSPRERQSIPLLRNLVEGGETAVGILENARRESARLATGDEADDPSAIRAKRDAIYNEIQRAGIVPDARRFADAGLTEAMGWLYEAYKGAHGRLTEAESRVAELEAEVRSLEEAKANQQAEFAAQIEEVRQKLSEIEADRERYRKERDQAVAALESGFEERRAQMDQSLLAARTRNEEVEQALAQLRSRLDSLTEKFGSLMIGPEALTTARKPDGRIITAFPGDDIVYINLSKDDRLVPGLQFAVYAAGEDIPADGRAKAQIEVIRIAEHSTECRIVRKHGYAPILEGDLIANPVYDPEKPLNFVVVGRFDLNGDGKPDEGADGAIEALIKDWGGATTREVTATTDFLVLGAPPPAPSPDSSRDITAEQRERQERTEASWNRYHEILSTAQSLSVPILSQDSFLRFLGYQGQLAAR